MISVIRPFTICIYAVELLISICWAPPLSISLSAHLHTNWINLNEQNLYTLSMYGIFYKYLNQRWNPLHSLTLFTIFAMQSQQHNNNNNSRSRTNIAYQAKSLISCYSFSKEKENAHRINHFECSGPKIE